MTVWLSLVFGAVVAFDLFVAVDESQPVGTKGAFEVVQVDAPSKATAIGAIEDSARELGLNVFKVQPDPRDSMEGRILFAFVGDVEAFESHGGFRYPAFAADLVPTRIVAGDTLTTEDLRGRYVTSAQPSEMAALLDKLTAAGLATRDASVSGIQLLLYSAAQANLVGAAAVVAIALVVAISHSVARRRKILALKALHGQSLVRRIGSEVKGATCTFVVGVAGLVIVGMPLLALYNGFRQAPRFGVVLASVLGVLYLVVVAIVVLSALTMSGLRAATVLKGQQAAVRNAVLAAFAHVAVLAIVLATAASAMGRMEAIGETEAISGQWARGGPMYALRVGVETGHEDLMRGSPRLAAAIRELERSSSVVLVGDKGVTGPNETGVPTDPEGVGSLLVNAEYVRRQAVRDDSGRQIIDLPERKDRFALLVPQDFPGDAAALLERYASYFRDFACESSSVGGASSCDPTGTIIRTKPGQTLFAYNGTSYLPAELQNRSFLRDPVLAVVSADSGLLGPMEYWSYVSLDDVLFTDPAALATALEAHGIAGLFQGIDNAADAVATSVSLAHRELRMDSVSFALGWAVLVLSTMVMVAVYCDRRMRPMFVGLIHGHSFMARHWRYLAGATGLCLAGVALAVIAGLRLDHGRDLTTAIAFVGTELGITLLAVRAYESRFRADFIKRS